MTGLAAAAATLRTPAAGFRLKTRDTGAPDPGTTNPIVATSPGLNLTACPKAKGATWRRLTPTDPESAGALIDTTRDPIRQALMVRRASLTVLQSEPLGFDVGKDPADPTVDAHIGVWQSQLSMTWHLGH